MTDPPKVKVVLDKRQLLSDFAQVQLLMQDYRSFLSGEEKPEGWDPGSVKYLRHLQLQLFHAKISLGTVDLVSSLLKQILVSIPTEQFHFKSGAGVAAVADTSSDSDHQQPSDNAGEEAPYIPPPEQLISWINGLMKSAPLEVQEKFQGLMGGINDFFEHIQTGDRQGVETAMSRINLLTTNLQTKNLVREIALITRDVFEALKMVSEDIPLSSLAGTSGGITEAVKRLHQVVTRLDDATVQSIDLLEKITNSVSENEKTLGEVVEVLKITQNQLMRFKEGHPEVAARIIGLQDRLSDQVGSQVLGMQDQARKNKEIYIELISNHGFHELSARTLKKVIVFVESLEKQLLDMLSAFRPDVVQVSVDTGDASAPIEIREESETQSQAEVDKLLGELGF